MFDGFFGTISQDMDDLQDVIGLAASAIMVSWAKCIRSGNEDLFNATGAPWSPGNSITAAFRRILDQNYKWGQNVLRDTIIEHTLKILADPHTDPMEFV